MLKIVMTNDGIYLSLHCIAIRYPLPGSAYTIHQTILYRRTTGKFKIFCSLPTLPRYAKALALMLAAAFGSYFSVTYTQQGIKATYVHRKLVAGSSIIAAEVKGVPEYPLCLPWLYPQSKLLSKLSRI